MQFDSQRMKFRDRRGALIQEVSVELDDTGQYVYRGQRGSVLRMGLDPKEFAREFWYVGDREWREE